ncbi:MAG: hypothetical protein EOP60_08755 [Sphingomonadales bacterium]|nr:MAG: hypothetical protein EOP60_08755 [Sphingomonadales bacterium]
MQIPHRGQIAACAMSALLLLAGCSGGGGPSGGGGGGATNVAPAFAGNATAGIEVAENVTGTIYQAAATDANNDSLTYAILAGEDGARFSLTADGKLSFVASPDFENPVNVALNNDYQLRITASDGKGGSATLALRVRVTNSTEGITTRQIASGFAEPVAALLDDRPAIYVAERGGAITSVNLFGCASCGSSQLQYGYRQPRIGTAGTLPSGLREGLLGIARGTGEYENRWFTLNASASGRLTVSQFLEGSRLWTSIGTVISIPSPETTTVAPAPGGWIGFGPDGYLYIATGDGAGLPINSTAQDTRTLRGKVLRIKPKIAGFDVFSQSNYTIPADNPFANGVSGAPEVWAYGFRDPRTANFVGSDLIVSDRDVDGAFSELNLIRPSDRGGNYGWPYFTGARPATDTHIGTFINPIIQWARNQGNNPTAGLLYDGAITSLRGSYLFADAETGTFWTLPFVQIQQGNTITVDQASRRNQDIVPDSGTITNPVFLSRGPNGDIYVVDKKGFIFALTAN